MCNKHLIDDSSYYLLSFLKQCLPFEIAVIWRSSVTYSTILGRLLSLCMLCKAQVWTQHVKGNTKMMFTMVHGSLGSREK